MGIFKPDFDEFMARLYQNLNECFACLKSLAFIG